MVLAGLTYTSEASAGLDDHLVCGPQGDYQVVHVTVALQEAGVEDARPFEV